MHSEKSLPINSNSYSTEIKDFRMVVKVFSEVFSEWEGIGHCIRIKERTMNDLKKACKRKFN